MTSQSAKEWLARCTRISLRGLVTSSKSREAAEAFLGASGFCKSSVDSCVWTPELEMSSLHLSLIRCGLLALFKADIYRKLYPCVCVCLCVCVCVRVCLCSLCLSAL